MELHLAGTGAISVEWIAEDGDSQSFFMGGVQSELVGSAGDGDELDACQTVLDADFTPMSNSHFAMQLIINLEGSVFYIESEWQLDDAA